MNKYGTTCSLFFQQDASAHTMCNSVAALQNIFWDQIISRPLWFAHLPILTAHEYYLWESLKDNVYKSNPHTHMTHLKKSSGTQYEEFLDKQIKEYLIICSPGAKDVSDLNKVISNTYSNMQ
jgi:hypothetical protein